MIRAMYLRNNPEMDSVSTIDVLDELDLTNHIGDTNVYDSLDYKISRDLYASDKYFITIFKSNRTSIINILAEIYETLQNAAPKFIKVFTYNNSIITAIPNYKEPYEDTTYATVIDELVRLSAFFFKKFGGSLASLYLKEYISLNVSYPDNRPI